MANIFSRIFNTKTEKRSAFIGPTNGLGLPYGYAPYPISELLSMQLSTVYRCVDVISDAIASQIWEKLDYKDGGWRLIRWIHLLIC